MVNRPNSNSTSPIVPIMIMMGVFAIVLAILLSNRTYVPVTTVASAPTIEPTPTLITEIAVDTYAASDIAQGRTVYAGLCSACHGIDAKGITGNGKPLVGSEFVDNLNDQELHDFIAVGRQPWDAGNTTGIPMPARGGNPSLSDEDIFKVIAYIRTLNDPSLISEDSTDVAAVEPTSVPADSSVSTPTPGESVTIVIPTTVPAIIETVSDPEGDYALLCSACHGIDGSGVDGVVALNESGLLENDDELYTFLAHGQPEVDPATGVPHPGYWNVLSPEDIRALIDYIQELPATE